VIIVFAPSQRETRQSNNISDTKKSTSKHGEATDQRGLRPNAEPGRGDLDSRHNTQKGNTVERYPDAKGGLKKKISSQAGIKQGTADKAPTSRYEGVEDKASISSIVFSKPSSRPSHLIQCLRLREIFTKESYLL
jgi:hypothetical protein